MLGSLYKHLKLPDAPALRGTISTQSIPEALLFCARSEPVILQVL